MINISVSSSTSSIFSIKPYDITESVTEEFSQKSDNDIWIDQQINEICKKGSSKMYSSNSKNKIINNETKVYKVYTRRWFILILFGLYSGSSSSHWLHYTIIGNVVQRYYNLSNDELEWTSLIFLILYIPLIFPGSWFLDKMGLRWSVLFGATINFIGSWMKVISVRQDLFYVGFVGHSLVSGGQIFVLALPTKIAAVWFGENQVAFASAFCVFGNQLGIASSFMLPPLLVKNHEDVSLIGKDLKKLFYSVALFSTALLILIILFFQAEPPTPPSIAQEKNKQKKESKDFWPGLKRLMTIRNFILLNISYGMSISVFYCLSTFLNPLVLLYNPGHEIDAGRIGLAMVLGGMVGALISGIILDRTHRYKETSLTLCILAMIAMWIFTFTINSGNIAILYVTSTILATFLMGYLLVGLEFGVELTYPEPEGTSSGILTLSTLLCGMCFTIIYGKILDIYGDIYANISISLLLCICIGITILIKNDLRRQAVQNKG